MTTLASSSCVEGVRVQWGVRIPMRDGASLNATLYRPEELAQRYPGIVTLTPYIADSFHDRGMYFASQGFLFVVVDVRGRGESDGVFKPFVQEAADGFDAVEWLAQQPDCDGKVGCGVGPTVAIANGLRPWCCHRTW